MTSDPNIESERRYRHAAFAYMAYGIVYMVGAGHLGLTGMSSRAAASGSWVWYAAGALFIALFPWLIARGYTWFTRVIAALLVVRIAGLFGVATGPKASDEIPLVGDATITTALGASVFAAVAAVALVFLARASFRRAPKPATGTAS